MANDTHKLTAQPKLTIKAILLDNHHWWHVYQQNIPTIRDSVKDNIIKLIRCKRRYMGFAHYCCSNTACGHAKIVPFTCNGRRCARCGYKLTQK